MKLGGRAYLHTPALISILCNNFIKPLEEKLVVVGEVPDHHTNDFARLCRAEDNRLICFDDVLKAVWIKLVEGFPGLATSAIGVRCLVPVPLPDPLGLI
jgi:hypothetical protein